MKERRKK